MSDPNERISIEELAIRTHDSLVRNAKSGLTEGAAPVLLRNLGGLLIESANEMDSASSNVVEPDTTGENARISDEDIDAAYAQLEAAREAHPRIRRGVGVDTCADRSNRRIPLKGARPRNIPSRQTHSVHIVEPTVDEMLEAHVNMPHMVSAEAVIANEPTDPVEQEVFSEETQEFVQSLLARWRGMTQLKREQGHGKVRQFFAAGLDALGLDRDLHDEAVTAKAVEVDRVLQIASQMIANGQDVSGLAAKYPAVKDLGRFLRTLEYDAPPSRSRVYADSDNHVFGGRVDASTKPTVVLDGESMDWVAAQDELDAEMLRITDKYTAKNVTSEAR